MRTKKNRPTERIECVYVYLEFVRLEFSQKKEEDDDDEKQMSEWCELRRVSCGCSLNMVKYTLNAMPS